MCYDCHVPSPAQDFPLENNHQNQCTSYDKSNMTSHCIKTYVEALKHFSIK